MGSSFQSYSAAVAISLALPCPATMATTASAASPPALTPELVTTTCSLPPLWAVATTHLAEACHITWGRSRWG